MPANALMQPRIDGTMLATPRNALLGYIADALNAANNYANKPNPAMPMGKANPPLSLLANALGVGDLGATADSLSYGRNLTQGQGMARQMLPETANALLTAGPLAAKFPKQAAAVTAGLLSGDTSAARAAMVWHGSPHKFDKFDSSKIGTGEGAQAYGHGLYLAESPEVAQSYQTANTFRAFDVAPEAEKRGLQLSAGARGELIRQAGANPDPMTAARRLQYANAGTREIPQEKLADLIKAYQDAQGGALYKVDLPDSAISRMLDWDKPLSQQAPAIQDVFAGSAKYLGIENPMELTGRDAYRRMHEAAIRQGKAEPAAIKEAQMVRGLQKAGIPGVRYLDGGSRGAGAGTSNFVVFPGEENMLSILERNGVPLK